MPDMKNAWMRRQEAMLNFKRRNHSVAIQANSKMKPGTNETLDQSQFQTANFDERVTAKIHSQHQSLAVQPLTYNAGADARVMTVNEEVKSSNLRASSTQTVQTADNQSDEKWKVFLNPAAIKPEVFQHNIFTDDQKSKAQGIYKRRLDTYLQIRKELSPEVLGNQELHMGQLYQLLLKDNPSLVLKKRRFNPSFNTSEYPLPSIISRSRSPLESQKINTELDQFKSFLEKKHSQQTNVINSGLDQTRGKIFVESSQFIDGNIIENEDFNSDKRPFKVKRKQSDYSFNFISTRQQNEDDQDQIQIKVQKRLDAMKEYVSGLQIEISKSNVTLQNELATHIMENDKKRLSKLPKDINQRSFLDMTESYRNAIQITKRNTDKKHIKAKLLDRLSRNDHKLEHKNSESNEIFEKSFIKANESGSLTFTNRNQKDEETQNLNLTTLNSLIVPRLKGKTADQQHLDDIKQLIQSMPKKKIKDHKLSYTGNEWAEFRAIFIKIAKNLLYNQMACKYPNKLKNKVFQDLDALNAFENQDKILKSVLSDEFLQDQNLVALSCIENLKHMNSFDETQEYSNLLVFIEEFTNLNKEQTAYYMQNLFKKLNLLQVSGYYPKEPKPTETDEQFSAKTQPNFKEDKGIIYGYQTSSESESEADFKPIVRKNIFHEYLEKSQKPIVEEGVYMSIAKLLQKLEFKDIMKKGGRSAINLPEDDAKVQFCRFMHRSTQLAMPLLDNQGRSLFSINIVNKLLSETKIQALIDAARYFNTLQTMVLDNTNISDNFLSKLLQNICLSAFYFRQLTYRGQNQIGNLSIQHLVNLFQRKIPHQFEELRIERVKVHAESPNNLLLAIQQSKSIKRLALSDIILQIDGLKILQEFITNSNTLLDLDLSHLHLPVLVFLRIFEAIIENPKLQYVNISGNQIVDLQPKRFQYAQTLDVRPIVKFRARKVQNQKIKQIKEANDSDSAKESEEDEDVEDDSGSENEEAPEISTVYGRVSTASTQQYKKIRFKSASEENIAILIEMLFTRNKCLMHCDFSHTGLTRKIIEDLAKLLISSPQQIKNLRALHFTLDEPKLDKQWIQNIKKILGQPEKLPEDVKRSNNYSIIEEEPEDVQSDDYSPDYNSPSKISQHSQVSQQKISGQIQVGQSLVDNINITNLKRKLKQDIELSSDKKTVLDSVQSICISRIIGHDSDFGLNADQIALNTWRLDTGSSLKCCWVCQKAVYTVFVLELNGDEVAKANEIQLEFYQDSVPLYIGQSLQIQGEAQQRFDMIKVQDLCQALEQQEFSKLNFLKILIEAQCCAPDVTKLDQLKRKERERYNQLLESYKYQEFCQEWQTNLAKHIDYKQVRIIGSFSLTKGKNILKNETGSEKIYDISEQSTMSEKEVQDFFDNWVPKTPKVLTKQVLVCPLLIRPGNIQYQFIEKSSGRIFRSNVRKGGSEFNSAHFSKTFFGEMRTEPIPFVISSKQRRNILKPFDKISSIFCEQKDDELSNIKMMQESDFKNWNVHRVIKSESDLRAIKAVISKHLITFTVLFVELASSEPSYPKISFPNFINFAKLAGFLTQDTEEEIKINQELERSPSMLKKNSQKNSSLARPKPSLKEIDVSYEFSQSCISLEKLVTADKAPQTLNAMQREAWARKKQHEELLQGKGGLDRCQFYELLVRCGIHKYFSSQYDKSMTQAVKRFLENDVLKHIQVTPIQRFRKQILWTTRTNQIFESNLKSLQRVYESLFDEEKKVFTQKTAIRIVLDKIYGIEEFQARKIFAKSKMFVVNERTQTEAYQKLKFLEFLEMLGRVADYAMKKDIQTNMEFEEYLAIVVDTMLAQEKIQRTLPAMLEDSVSEEDQIIS